MKSRFIGIGIGPGDPELLTVKAVKEIEKASIIVVPCSKSKESTALNIAKEYINESASILEMIFPMVYCEYTLKKAWQENINTITKHLEEGKDVAFLTLGDPMVYSTFIYVMKAIKDLGFYVESIPGITSFCAVANRALLPLAEGDEAFTVIPLNEKKEHLEKSLQDGKNVVVLKASHDPVGLAEVIKRNKLEDSFIMCSNCGKKNEKITSNIQDLNITKVPYFSTVIIKNKKK
ncbi:precorrin-2 C(20)-methyltransferase [Alkaliphilus peptidifermentans]|uniref:Precorrin-2/cobalt-factor-2 C20-methyltransferase n=1 Tax=Alkaliphilus peptidifermentans DSM 18978 TaxID=1120976 RepID=A0A1G5AQI3_9FIRM|nr:precorrin-2 C(20)-methyltransferase [Alkaliphilus peptidifermentans]SCX80138.1 precorrin-2/cobalt-factor-2 C20-methyltransferase [Alkaliphilus peptidifermentans DSM 18978]